MADRPSFCSACGAAVAPPDAVFCGRCGARIGAAGAGPAAAGAAAGSSAMQAIINRITDTVGLERLEGFSVRALFSETLRHRGPDEMERYLGVGTPDTTPPLTAEMGQWPRPWLFLRTLVFALVAYGVLLLTWKEFGNINVVPALIIVGSFAVPLATLILFFELNTPKNVSILRVVQLVVLGGVVSIGISLFLFRLTNLSSWLGPPAAAFIEEVGKLAALLLLARFAQQERYAFALNGLLFGAAVGAGFAAFESAGYALRIGLRSADDMLTNITVRGLLSPFAHIAWTAIAACAVWRVRAGGETLLQALMHRRFLVLFAVPVALHFTWNSAFQLPLMLKYVALGFLAYVVIFSLVQSGLKEVKRTASPDRLDLEALDPTTMIRTMLQRRTEPAPAAGAGAVAAAVPAPHSRAAPPAPAAPRAPLAPLAPPARLPPLASVAPAPPPMPDLDSPLAGIQHAPGSADIDIDPGVPPTRKLV
ncbi:MAG: PrsW family intramembrane metalloprotease [Burkholderiales bacterium]|nr:PrsW family intramembrane metalloprotease [Burkholderiales bacterium]